MDGTMTSRITVHEAKTNLSELLRRVEAGEEVVIARGNKPVAVLSAYRSDDIAAKRRAGLGSLAGQFEAPADEALIGSMIDEELEAAFGEAAELFK